MPVYLIGTLDTKGQELAFVRDLLQHLELATCVVDAGCLGDPAIAADINRSRVFQAAGTSLSELQDAGDRGRAVTAAAEGVAAVIREAQNRGECDAVLGIGGSAGTTIATAAMRVLPLGVPKVMVSTLASGQTRHWVGDKDILMLNSVVDISGINRISRVVLSEAAFAVAGMVKFHSAADPGEPAPGSSGGQTGLFGGRQTSRGCDNVWRYDRLRRTRAQDSGSGRLRSPCVSRDGCRRTGDGVAD